MPNGFSSQIPWLTASNITDESTLRRLTDFLRSLELQAGENVQIDRRSGQTLIQAPPTPTSSPTQASNNFITSIVHEGSSVFTVVLAEIEVTYPYTRISTVSSVTWQFQLSGSIASVNFYVEPNISGSPRYIWRKESGTIVGNDATTIAAQSTATFIPEGLLEVAEVIFNSSGNTSTYSNKFPTLEVTMAHDTNRPTFVMVDSGGASKLLAVSNLWYMDVITTTPSRPASILLADGTYTVYTGWDSSNSVWKLTTTPGTYQAEFLIGQVEIASNEISEQKMYTGQLVLPNVGLANQNRNFTDNGGNNHAVTIRNGVITAWTVT